MTTTQQPLTWLITGSSAGFGLALARVALAQGHNVIATSRNPARTPEYVREIVSSPQGKWLTLDVTADTPTIQLTLKTAVDLFGTIDVLVNNAGYSVIGAAEDIPEDKARAQFDVNFWGAVRITQATLPYMRVQGSGTIVNISSIAGVAPLPACTMYTGSKFALEGWSESLSLEVAPLGIRILIVEPGAFRTNFLSDNAIQYVQPSQAYEGGVVSQTIQKFTMVNGGQPGDPVKACQRIVENVQRGLSKEDWGKTNKLRLPLGKDCFDRIMVKMTSLNENWSYAKADAHGLEVTE